jgi:hypothetical protein
MGVIYHLFLHLLLISLLLHRRFHRSTLSFTLFHESGLPAAVRALVFGFHVHVFLLRTKVRSQFSSSPAIDARFQGSLNFPLPPEALHLLLPPQVYKLVLLDLPGLLFFSTYTLLVLFWAEIYHQVPHSPFTFKSSLSFLHQEGKALSSVTLYHQKSQTK